MQNKQITLKLRSIHGAKRVSYRCTRRLNVAVATGSMQASRSPRQVESGIAVGRPAAGPASAYTVEPIMSTVILPLYREPYYCTESNFGQCLLATGKRGGVFSYIVFELYSHLNMSGLTKEQLKNELITHGVELPSSNARKGEYVQLYDKYVAPVQQSRGDFSSDEEDLPNSVAGTKVSSISALHSGIIPHIKYLSKKERGRKGFAREDFWSPWLTLTHTFASRRSVWILTQDWTLALNRRRTLLNFSWQEILILRNGTLYLGRWENGKSP